MKIPRSIAIFALVVLAVAAGVGAWGFRRPGPTDAERIRALLDRASRAVEQKRPADVMDGVSERFQGEGMGRRELHQFVTYNALRGSWNAVIPMATRVRVEGDRADAVVDVALLRGAPGQGIAGRMPEAGDTWRVEAALEREKGEWRVVSARWRRIGLAEGLTGSPP
jgi:hypothetical protein